MPTPPTPPERRSPDWMLTPETPERLPLNVRHPRLGRIVTRVAVVVFVLCLVGVVGTVIFASFRMDADRSAPVPANDSEVVAASTTPTAGAVAGPFAGTPAARFPEGADGITLPAAQAVGSFTVEQVEDALASVKWALVAARLDAAMLVRRDPEPFLDQLAPAVRDHTRSDFASPRFAAFASQIAPGTELTRHRTRVSGRVSYRATTNPRGVRVIEVTTSFVWVYAFVPAGPGNSGLVIARDEVVWQIPRPTEVTAEHAGLWLVDARGSASHVDCAQHARGFLAPAGRGRPPGDAFDPNRRVEASPAC